MDDLASPYRIKRFSFPGPDGEERLPDRLWCSAMEVARLEERVGVLAEHLLFAVAGDILRTFVPGHDAARGRGDDDGIGDGPIDRAVEFYKINRTQIGRLFERLGAFSCFVGLCHS